MEASFIIIAIFYTMIHFSTYFSTW